MFTNKALVGACLAISNMQVLAAPLVKDHHPVESHIAHGYGAPHHTYGHHNDNTFQYQQ